MIFTTNKNPKPTWGSVLHDDDLAEAIVDRILERGRVLRLDGPSVRTKHLPADEAGGEDARSDEVLRISGKKVSEFPEPPATSGLRGPSRARSPRRRHPYAHRRANASPTRTAEGKGSHGAAHSHAQEPARGVRAWRGRRVRPCPERARRHPGRAMDAGLRARRDGEVDWSRRAGVRELTGSVPSPGCVCRSARCQVHGQPVQYLGYDQPDRVRILLARRMRIQHVGTLH